MGRRACEAGVNYVNTLVIEWCKMDDEAQDLDARVFKDRLETLLIKSANMLERAWPERYKTVPNAHAIFFTRMRITINSYNAILALTADIPKDLYRKPLLFAAAPLVRSVFEDLATLIFLLVDLPNLSISYTAGGYAELWFERRASEKYYGDIPKWQIYIAELDEKMDELATQLKLTPAQAKDPFKEKLVWPTPGRKMLNVLKARYGRSQVIPFMEFLNRWMYRTLSTDSHLNFIGMQKRGMHFTKQFAKHVLGDKYEKILEARRLDYHKNMTWSTYTLLLSIVSEIEAHFHYDMKNDIYYLWKIFVNHSEMAQDFYKLRYRDLLASS